MRQALAHNLRHALNQPGYSQALFHGGRWRDGAWISRGCDALDGHLRGVTRFGLVARNTPEHIAAFASGIVGQRTTTMIYAAQSPASLANDVRRLNLPAVVAARSDWSLDALVAAREVGSAAIAIDDGGR
ncbi:hypothetical protein AB5I41_14745 [Sphingomonas sp. MMS24-JH45]